MMSLEIDVERCKGCELCVGACPSRVLVMSDDTNSRGQHYASLGSDNCNECSMCYQMCPDMAIQNPGE